MDAPQTPAQELVRHKRWVRGTHWIITLSFFVLLFSGVEILMVHPRLYWGEVGNDLTPALFELPISRNYKHGGWENSNAFYSKAGSPVSASRTYDIFNKNGWGRSLHFLAAWFLVITGVIYLLAALISRHLKKRFGLTSQVLKPGFLWGDFIKHFGKMPLISDAETYGILQKLTYLVVIFLLLPLIIITGLTMSPAITAAYPFLLKIFGGVQSARTIHFFTTIALVLFLIIHVVMVIRTGFKKQMRAMTIGK